MEETREEYVYRRAFDLAAGGEHISAITIVSALVDEGYPESSDLLSTVLIRADLNGACAKNWQRTRRILR